MKKMMFAAALAAGVAAAPASAVTYINNNTNTAATASTVNLNVGIGSTETGFSRKLTNNFNWLISIATPANFNLATASLTVSLATGTTSITPSMLNFYVGSCDRMTCTGGTAFTTGGTMTGPASAFFGNASEQFAPGTPLTIRFVGTSTGTPTAAFSFDYGFASVPEPTTWAMMIVGVGAAGGMMRRRRVLKLA